jgi:hypothetical protein
MPLCDVALSAEECEVSLGKRARTMPSCDPRVAALGFDHDAAHRDEILNLVPVSAVSTWIQRGARG